MKESVRGFLQQQRLPLIITALALLLAFYVGLIPVLSSDDEPEAAQQTDRSAELAALDERLTALETAQSEGGDGISPRLRAELDLISKGLLNQTGRVSRLKKQIEAPGESEDGISPRLRAELDLIGKGLLTQTGRVSALKKQLASQGEDGISGTLRAELDLINKGLLNQTGRVSALKKDASALSSVPGTLKRLDLEVANLNKAVGRLHLRFQNLPAPDQTAADEFSGLKDQIATIQDQIDGVRQSLSSVTDQLDASISRDRNEEGSLTAIEAKLDQLLQSLSK